MILDQNSQLSRKNRWYSKDYLPLVLVSLLILLLVVDTFRRYALPEPGVDTRQIIGLQLSDSLIDNTSSEIGVGIIILFSETCQHCKESIVEWGDMLDRLPTQTQESVLFISTTPKPAAQVFLSQNIPSSVKYQSNGKLILEALSVNQVPLYIRIDAQRIVRDIGTSIKALKRIIGHGTT